MFTLEQLQDVFGSEIAGNQTVMGTDVDGWDVCYCDVEIDGVSGRVYFDYNRASEDWNVMTRDEARARIASN